MNEPTAVFRTLIEATNRHDLDGIVACFADDVVSETPAHPARSFVGSDQIRRNWSQILGSIGDFHATIHTLETGPSGQVGATAVWAELAFDGTRPDGLPFQLRGVTVNEVLGGRIARLRFYLEPVEAGGLAPQEAVRAALGSAMVGSGAILEGAAAANANGATASAGGPR